MSLCLYPSRMLRYTVRDFRSTQTTTWDSITFKSYTRPHMALKDLLLRLWKVYRYTLRYHVHYSSLEIDDWSQALQHWASHHDSCWPSIWGTAPTFAATFAWFATSTLPPPPTMLLDVILNILNDYSYPLNQGQNRTHDQQHCIAIWVILHFPSIHIMLDLSLQLSQSFPCFMQPGLCPPSCIGV